MRQTIAGLFLTLMIAPHIYATELAKLEKADLAVCQASDADAVLIYRDGLRDVIRYADSRRDLFPATTQKEPLALTPQQRDEARVVWRSFLDYQLALESIRSFHSGFFGLSKTTERDSFLITYAAFLAEYRSALELIERADRNPGHQVQLNDGIPELGVPAGAWSRMKLRFLNVAIASEFAALDALRLAYSGGDPRLNAAIDSDRRVILAAGTGTGPKLTAINALQVAKDLGKHSWLPVQTHVASWMGDTRVRRAGLALISTRQIAAIAPRFLPGDVLFERREWYLSNIGLPGFWTHVALYIGTPDQRRAFFNDAGTRAWVRAEGEASGDFERLLATKREDAYARSRTREHGNVRRAIEAIGEGVSFTSLEHTAAADSLGVLRPRLPVKERAIAIYRAFGYAGRPYDYDFDFLSDDALVCSELIYKAYEPGEDMRGLHLELSEVAGHRVVPPNEIVRQWTKEVAAGNAQFDFVLFLDGFEKRGAVEASEASFRQTWTRPRWHIMTTMAEH